MIASFDLNTRRRIYTEVSNIHRQIVAKTWDTETTSIRFGSEGLEESGGNVSWLAWIQTLC
jgi:uncharacterized membrane protein